MAKEIWAAITNHPGYEVSTLGRVRSLDRVYLQRGKTGSLYGRKGYGKLLKLYTFSNGYQGVRLGRRKTELVHRLVAIAFVDGDTSLQVNHKDGIRNNNKPSNLEWLSCSDNHKHSYRELTRKKHCKTNPVVMGGIRFPSEKACAEHYGVVPGSVHSALKRGHKCKGHEVFYG